MLNFYIIFSVFYAPLKQLRLCIHNAETFFFAFFILHKVFDRLCELNNGQEQNISHHNHCCDSMSP